MLLSRALTTLGRIKDAQAILAPYWRETKLELADEQRILREFSALLTPADHRWRMENMLYSERIGSADRVAKRAEARAAHEGVGRRHPRRAQCARPAQGGAGRDALGWILFRRGEEPAAQEEICRGGGRDAEGADRSRIDHRPGCVVGGAARAVARARRWAGDMKLAYRIASAHAAETPVEAADAEFHAGWMRCAA